MDFNFKFLQTTKKIKKLDLSIAILLIVGIAAVINFLSYQIFTRLDLTQGKIYSISAASKKTVGNLDDVVNIKAYFSNNLPNQFVGTRQEAADILGEYEAYAKGKIKVDFIDPDTDELKQEIYAKGIPQLTFQTVEKDQAQSINGYLGIAINYGDKTEVIPVVEQDANNLEYQLTTAIKKAIAKEITTVGYVTSNKTADPTSDAKAAYTALQQLYNVKEIKLDKQEISADIKTLIIFGPKDAFTEDQLKTINSFVARGGSLLVLLDGVTVSQGLAATPNNTNLEKLLAKYGVIVNKDLIVDERNGLAPFSQGGMTFVLNYAYWPRITKDSFNQNISTVSSLENVIMPWVSSIDIDESKINRNAITTLAFTSDKAWVVKDNFNLSPSSSLTNPGKPAKYNVIMSVNGLVNNAYPETGENKQFNSRIIIAGDSDFAINNAISSNVNPNTDNGKLFLNLVDSLTLDQDLINIRSKGVTSRPVKQDLSESTKALIRYGNVFGITIVVLAFGLLRYYLRRKSKFVDDI